MRDFTIKNVQNMVKIYNSNEEFKMIDDSDSYDTIAEYMQVRNLSLEYYALFIGPNEITTGDIADIGTRVWGILKEYGLDYDYDETYGE